MTYLIKNARLADGESKISAGVDIIISGGKIETVGKNLKTNSRSGLKVIDASGKIAMPGLIDMHSHFRSPGREDTETVASGSRAALKGGFTGVAVMPNTDPALDTPELIRFVAEEAKARAAVRVHIIGAATKGRSGTQPTDIEALKKAGAVAVSDDGSCISDDNILRAVLRKSAEHGLVLIDHCEDRKLSGKGVMHEGFMSTKLGLRGIPSESEWSMVKRDIEYAKGLDVPVHIAHISCKESCEIVRKAKKSGVAVTAETAPHYFTLTDEACQGYDTRTKMNPPLRERADVEAVKEALADGTIDVIASDHAPHGLHDKYVEFDSAAFGIIGLETSLSLAAGELISKKIIDWQRLVQLMSINPARILKIDGGTLKKGSKADITLVDPDAEYTYEQAGIESRSKNSPFIGWKLKGMATEVFIGGELKLSGGKILD